MKFFSRSTLPWLLTALFAVAFVVLAAILFGALYQGGSELSFDVPTLTRDIVVVIQGLIILVCGALEHALERAGLTQGDSPDKEDAIKRKLLDRVLLVFDEIDSGIGGRSADPVGRTMQIGAGDRAASVPDAWWRRRQRGTEWEQER